MPQSTHEIAIAMGRLGHDTQVILDGVEISGALRGIEVRAEVGELSRVVLEVLANVEVSGVAGEVVRSFPRDDRINAIIAPPNAVIVVSTKQKMPREAQAHIAGRLREAFPNNRILVLDEGLNLTIIEAVLNRGDR